MKLAALMLEAKINCDCPPRLEKLYCEGRALPTIKFKHAVCGRYKRSKLECSRYKKCSSMAGLEHHVCLLLPIEWLWFLETSQDVTRIL
mmetsp:Transcript_120797/g.180448  ORF Transcript_120797/g.180448 Transcript_120797/m.180448 type:complete len:89 (+) Transcript_120797:338-604(+)